MKRITEVHVPPEWEAALLSCLDNPPRRPKPWMPWVYGGMVLTSGFGFAGIFMFVHP